jgi:L-rhamnose-H+ transport protein
MNFAGIALAALSGICNGLFTAPMRLPSPWKWENTWFVFILVSCIAMPLCIVTVSAPEWLRLIEASPRPAVVASLGFGFAWGFGAISFGQSVKFVGVSIANSLVIGLSSALGSLVPLILGGSVLLGLSFWALMGGILAFLLGVALCGAAGWLRDKEETRQTEQVPFSARGYLFAIVAGIMSAIFNIGFTLALPIAQAGKQFGMSQVAGTNCIWLLMLGAGSIPNLVYCALLMRKNSTGTLLGQSPERGWPLAIVMGLLWGGSIFLYGAAVPKLGNIGPSIGWPLSLAVGLAVANAMGIILREWQAAPRRAVERMRWGLCILFIAILLCAWSAGTTT